MSLVKPGACVMHPAMAAREFQGLWRGLVAAWLLTERSGTRITDVTSYRQVGTINGAAWVMSPDGPALFFEDTEGDDVSLGNPTHLQFTSSFSLLVVGMVDDVTDNEDYVLISKSGGSAARGHELRVNVFSGADVVSLQVAQSNSVLVAADGGTSLALNRWYVMAGRYNAAIPSMDVFLDGRRDTAAVGTVPTSAHNSANNWQLGQRVTGVNLSGGIAGVMMWNRALTDAEMGILGRDPFGPFRQAPRIFTPQVVVRRHRGWSRPGV